MELERELCQPNTKMVEDIKRKKNKKSQQINREGAARNINKNKAGNSKGNYPPCKHCEKNGHTPYKCWKRPDAKCNKCNQFGHEAIVCKNKTQQQDADAQVVNEEEEDPLFDASCFASNVSSESQLIDCGCTNHMTYDKGLFKELKPTKVAKVRIGHGDYIPIEGMETNEIETRSDSGTSGQAYHH